MGKARDFVTNLLSIQAIVTMFCLVAIVFSYFRMKITGIELEEYLSAKPCSDEGICREKVESQIIESKEKNTSITTLNKQGKTSTEKNVNYQLLVFSPLKNYKAVITPGVFFNKIDMNVSDLYVPSIEDASFFEMNLYKNRKVFIEIWKDKVTLLFVDAIITAHDGSEISNSPSSPQFINNVDNKTFIMALVTDDHPAIRKLSANNDFFSVCVICFILLLPLHWDGMKRLRKKFLIIKYPKKIQGE
ncbi:MAG: hypothetical protein IPP55_16695 [Anaerolineales bacterium]|nr:hypothetical protein [Anaerolineales bacterium]